MFKLYIILFYLTTQLFSSTTAQDYNCLNAVRSSQCPHPDISFWLYRWNSPVGILMQYGHCPSCAFNVNRPLTVLIHSYTGNRDSTPNLQIRPALRRIRGVNIISVDYSMLVPNLCYKEAVQNAHLVGRCLSHFLMTFIRRRLVRPQDVHLIGFGLGAHVAGFTAKFLKHFNVRVGRITGLDPAKPHFQTLETSERLDSSDADFVDIIHTDITVHGLMMPIGHVDFYPNNGVEQPNCGPLHEIRTHLCFHHRAAVYYAESIFSSIGFLGFHCNDFNDFLSYRCFPGGILEPMGYNARHSARGSFFLKTNSFAPYARGSNFENMNRSILGINYEGPELNEKLQELRLGDLTVTSSIIIDIMPVACTAPFPFCI